MLTASLLLMTLLGSVSSCKTNIVTECRGSVFTYTCPSSNSSHFSFIVITQLPERNSSKYYPDDRSFSFNSENGSGSLQLGSWGRHYLLEITCQSYPCGAFRSTERIQNRQCPGTTGPQSTSPSVATVTLVQTSPSIATVAASPGVIAAVVVVSVVVVSAITIAILITVWWRWHRRDGHQIMEEGCQNFEGTGPQTHHQETSSLPLLSDPTRSAPLPGPAPDPAPAPDKTEMGEPSAQPFTSAPSTSEPEEEEATIKGPHEQSHPEPPEESDSERFYPTGQGCLVPIAKRPRENIYVPDSNS